LPIRYGSHTITGVTAGQIIFEASLAYQPKEKLKNVTGDVTVNIASGK
jgi:hypothetical protein